MTKTKTKIEKLNPKLAKILCKAACEIEKRGWCQLVEQDDTGRVCGIGAIRKVLPFNVSYAVGPIFDAAAEAMGVGSNSRYGSVPDYNDASSRRRYQILARLRAAANTKYKARIERANAMLKDNNVLQ